MSFRCFPSALLIRRSREPHPITATGLPPVPVYNRPIGEPRHSLFMGARTIPVFTARETHGRALKPANRLIAHSQDVGWCSLYAAILEEAPLQATEPALGHPFLIYHLSRPTEVTRKIEGAARERTLIGPRRICLTPGETVTEWQHNGRPEILQVYLRQSLYEDAVSELYGCDPSSAELVPRFAMIDPLLEQLAIAIATALREGTAEDGIYVETLAQTLAVHLARTTFVSLQARANSRGRDHFRGQNQAADRLYRT